ncbi:MAG: hydantoinase/oxoprolinase family protein [Proteobacteria bacterium]|nr:hydantoinase/oxoprolinase family protein [Pseudomonadota bacterium]
MTTRIGVDTGGTFTDLIAHDEDKGMLMIAKALSTPRDPSVAIFKTIGKADIRPGDVEYFVHGTTVATNTLIERKGAKTGLIITKGFRDILRIQRVVRRYHFDLHWVKPRHLVPRRLSLEVEERTNAKGKVIIPLEEADVLKAIEKFKAEGVTAIAVSYLFSFLNPAHEQRTRSMIREHYPEAYVSISSEVFPQWREYERTSTTVIDAYLKPRMDGYISNLEETTKDKGIKELLIMRSNGGVMTTQSAKEQPMAMVRSGPAGGVIASCHIGRLTKNPNLIVADMGGTSFDTCLIAKGVPTFTTKEELEWGIPIASNMIDVRSIGAGGGSMAWIDAAGILKVGPQSAGADPGPVCYGKGGTVPTVTDANLVLGRLDPDLLLAGEIQVNLDMAKGAIKDFADRMRLDLYELAHGIVDIANNNMAQALRLVSVDKGHDPRDFAIIAFGGAGPMHAVELAKDLHVKKVIVPVYPGAFSALGALIADTRFDYMRTSIMPSTNLKLERINTIYKDLEERAREDFLKEGFDKPPAIQRTVEMRYLGQNWELEVEMPGGRIDDQAVQAARESFDREHATHFGWHISGEKFEFVNFKIVAIGQKIEVKLPEIGNDRAGKPLKVASVYFKEKDGFVECPVYSRDDLNPGTKLDGPVLIDEVSSTTLVPPDSKVEIDGYGNVVIEIGG